MHTEIVNGSVFGELNVVDNHEDARRRVLCICSCGDLHRIGVQALRRHPHPKCRSCAQRGVKRDCGPREVTLFPQLSRRDYYRLKRKVDRAIYRCHIDSKNEHYYARGIRVYKPWIEDKQQFIEYLLTLSGWNDASLSLDRIDNDGDYVPGNLRFVDQKIQRANQRC